MLENKMLYNPQEVRALLDSDSVVVIDIRDKELYQDGHIPGAVNVSDIFYYLAMTTPEGINAMHEHFKMVFSNAGVSNDKKVIVYENCLDTWFGGSCRGYWFLTYLGHKDVGILDGGMDSWEKQGFNIERGEGVAPKSADFTINPDSSLLANKEDVIKALNDSSVILIDNRNKEEWLAETSSPYGVDFAPRKGRIPGAVWLEWYDFMDRQREVSSFKAAKEIEDVCAKYNIYPDSDIILYCFKGARSSNTYIALKLAGFDKVRLYPGSWNEWSRDMELPVDEGAI